MRYRLPGIALAALLATLLCPAWPPHAVAQRVATADEQAAGANAASGEDTAAAAAPGTRESTALPGVAGLETIDFSDPASVRAQRTTWPHRAEVWAFLGTYALSDARTAIGEARDKGRASGGAAYRADLDLIEAIVAIEQGDLGEASQHLESARDAYRKGEDDKVGVAMATGYLGVLETAWNHPRKAESNLESAIDELSGTDERALEAYFRIRLADIHLRRDQIDEIVAEYQAAIDMARTAGNPFVEGLGLKHLGIAHLCRNEPALAASKIEAAIMVHRTAKQPLLQAGAHRMRAICHLLRGDFNNARLEARRAVKIEPSMSGRFPPWETSEGFFWKVYEWKGGYQKSLEYGARAVRKAETGGDRLLQAHLHRYRGKTWADLGHARNAMSELDVAASIYRELGDVPAWLATTAARVSVSYTLGDLDRMEALASEVEANPAIDSYGNDAVRLYRTLARQLNRVGEVDQALAWLGKAIAVAERTGDPVLKGDLLEHAGEILEDAGRVPGALEGYEKAWEVFLALDDPQWMPFVAGKLQPLLEDSGRKKEAKKVAKAAKPYKDFLWTPLLRPPTMPLASGTEMIRWMITVQKFGDLGSIGRAATYRIRYNVNKQFTSLNDYLGEFEQVVATFKASENVLGIVRPTDVLVRILIANDGWNEARQLREDQLKMVRDAGFYDMEHTYVSHAIDEYYQHEQPDRAIELAKQGIDLARETGNRWHELDMLLDLGDMQAEQKAYDDAITAGQAALNLAESLRDTFRTFYALGVLSAAHRGKNDSSEAAKYHDKAMALGQDLDLDEDSIEDQMKASNVYKLLGEYDKAIACVETAIGALPKKAGNAKEKLEEERDELEALRDGKAD